MAMRDIINTMVTKNTKFTKINNNHANYTKNRARKKGLPLSRPTTKSNRHNSMHTLIIII
jgi:hypothetical protein